MWVLQWTALLRSNDSTVSQYSCKHWTVLSFKCKLVTEYIGYKSYALFLDSMMLIVCLRAVFMQCCNMHCNAFGCHDICFISWNCLWYPAKDELTNYRSKGTSKCSLHTIADDLETTALKAVSSVTTLTCLLDMPALQDLTMKPLENQKEIIFPQQPLNHQPTSQQGCSTV